VNLVPWSLQCFSCSAVCGLKATRSVTDGAEEKEPVEEDEAEEGDAASAGRRRRRRGKRRSRRSRRVDGARRCGSMAAHWMERAVGQERAPSRVARSPRACSALLWSHSELVCGDSRRCRVSPLDEQPRSDGVGLARRLRLRDRMATEGREEGGQPENKSRRVRRTDKRQTGNRGKSKGQPRMGPAVSASERAPRMREDAVCGWVSLAARFPSLSLSVTRTHSGRELAPSCIPRVRACMCVCVGYAWLCGSLHGRGGGGWPWQKTAGGEL